MNVLIHTDEYYPTAQACTNRMRSFAEGLIKSGASVTVICSAANLENGEPGPTEERILYVPVFRMKKKTASRRLLNNISFAVSSFFCAMRAGKFDAVITTSPPPLISKAGWLTARLKKACLVYDVRDIWPDVALEMGSFRKNGIFDRVFRRITRFMYKHADMITTVSPGKMEKICGYVRETGSDAGKVRVVGNGFDENILAYPHDPGPAERFGVGKQFTCVYIGNIGMAQGLDSLLRLASETGHRDARFLLFGKGAEKERLEKAAREQGLDNVSFCGTLKPEEVPSVLRSAQLSFIPLKSAEMKDSIPTKLYEALGLGCPVLLMAEGDSCAVLDETGLGRHLSPDHPEQLAEVFDRLVDEYDDILTHRENAKSLIRSKYSRQKCTSDFADLLGKATE